MPAFLFLTVLICAGFKPSDPLDNQPQESKIRFSTIHYAEGKEKPRQLMIHGKLDGHGELGLDPNQLRLDSNGKIIYRTLLGWAPIPVQIKLVDTPDPGKKGRKVYDIIPDKGELKRSYSLIIAPTEAGPHELLIREGDKIVGTYPLVDPVREAHQELAPKLAKSSPEEQKAIAELHKIMGYNFQFEMESKNAVTALRLPMVDEIHFAKIDTAMQGLKNLIQLTFDGGKLPAEGLTSIRNMSSLKRLDLRNFEINDSGLACLKDATQLLSLTLYDCHGLTDKGLEHFKGLRNLVSLDLRNEKFTETEPKSPRITGAGLQHLAGCTKLERLNLMGHHITDDGLKHLSGMKELEFLALSFSGITDKGLKHLEGLPKLRYLSLYNTRVTPEGRAALKKKVPLRDW